jgi:2-polyprenyl-3-methyl-5-hydroxy-6-metoxy-1,4-benzoquinol methylase
VYSGRQLKAIPIRTINANLGLEMICVPNDKPAACPVCKRADHSTFFMCKNSYDLYKCAECRHIFVWPIPTIEALKHTYSFANSYQVQNKTIYGENTVVSVKTRESLKQIERFCRRGRLLDVGCSSGKFLWLAKRNGWSVCGVELNMDTAQIANDNGLNVSVGELASADYPPAYFDAIHLGDVIEHVRNPEDLLFQASALLKSDGVIVLVTPNHDAIFPLLTLWLHRLFKMPWSHPTPPYHLNQYSEKSLEKLLKNLNLKAISKQYRSCSLRYELGETHILASFRHALRERRFGLAAGRFLFAVFTGVAYLIAYCIDRCCVWKKKDFEMRFVVRKALCNALPATSPRVTSVS